MTNQTNFPMWEWPPDDTEYNRKRDLEEFALLTEVPKEDSELPPYTEGEEDFIPEYVPCNDLADELFGDWHAWDAWWTDDSLMFVDWPDPEPVQFDYSYRRPGWPRLS